MRRTARFIAAAALVTAVVAAATTVFPAAPGSATEAPHTLNCRQPGETPTAAQPLTLVHAPETLRDASGTAATAYAGFFVEQAVLRSGALTVVAYYDASKRLTVASRTGSSGAWTFAQPKDGTGTPVVLDGDSHNAIALTVDSSGALHMVANVHSSAMMYWRSTSGADPASLVFADHLVLQPSTSAAGTWTDDEGYVTYPRFFTAADGSLRLMFRGGWSDVGKTYLYAYDAAAKKWSNPLGGNALLDGWTGNGYSPYPDVPHYNPADGNYYLAYTWQESGRASSTSTVNLIRSTDLRTWTNVAGTPLTTPVHYSDADALVEDVPENSGLLNGNVRVGFDASGRPTVAYVREAATGTVLSLARRDGLNKSWIVNTVSRWTGHNDLTDETNLTRLTLSTGADASGTGSEMTVRYRCNGEVRDLTVGDGKFNGQASFVADRAQSTGALPTAITAPEFPGSAYTLTYRTALTPVAEGTLVLKWEAGPMIANGAQPDPARYPAGGSTLLLATVTTG